MVLPRGCGVLGRGFCFGEIGTKKRTRWRSLCSNSWKWLICGALAASASRPLSRLPRRDEEIEVLPLPIFGDRAHQAVILLPAFEAVDVDPERLSFRGDVGAEEAGVEPPDHVNETEDPVSVYSEERELCLN